MSEAFPQAAGGHQATAGAAAIDVNGREVVAYGGRGRVQEELGRAVWEKTTQEEVVIFRS